MPDEQKNSSPDDEYQFPQEEYAASETPTAEFQEAAAAAENNVAPGTGTRKKLFEGYSTSLFAKNKRIFIIVGVLILFLLLPKLFDIFKSPPSPVAEQQKQAVAQKQLVQPQPSIPAPAITEQPPMPALMPAQMPTQPMQPNNQVDSKIEDLQQQVSSMQESLTQSQSTNEQLQKSIAQLTAQVQVLSTQLKQNAAMEKQAPRTKKIAFYLRAVVPDRAWVMTNSGETVSVSVGDSLDQYGTIESIDPVYGVVQTSSGRKITYGSNDY